METAAATEISENPDVSTTEISGNPDGSATEIFENSNVSDAVVVMEQNHENSASEVLNNGDVGSQQIFSEEEVRSSLETSASSGKFWQDWESLRSILSYHLKQVLSQYPEAKMTSEQQISSLGETYEELVKRLDNALLSFDEGPPFTLQRLCEILLSARSIYPKLSKLSLALEKTLLVTSMLTISTDPHPLVTKQKSNGSHEASENAPPQTSSAENGVEEEPATGDKDEIMAEVEEGAPQEDMKTDMGNTEEIVRSSEANPTPTVDSQPLQSRF